MSRSAVYKLTLSAEVAALVEQHRGALSVQEFAIVALLEKCQGSPGERAARAEIDRLHATLARVLASPGAPGDTLSSERQIEITTSAIRSPGDQLALVEQSSKLLDW